EQTWLTQLNLDSGLEEETTASLKLTGFSFSAEELGNFLSQLTAEPLFKTVVLQQAREYEAVQLSKNVNVPVRLIQFNIDCNI
ncbi:MAG: PilN domain-containing protein, partial [Deltaproteobacteria bacterium]|nr:PilN domain-containing protein [Deltaproteobacteria bacterium]